MGCDFLCEFLNPFQVVSIHAPAWGATSGLLGATTLKSSFQSTHPHGVRLPLQFPAPSIPRVSIHAPAWGATRKLTLISPHRGVSIHAPAWGATSASFLVDASTLVSIHAPAWGATLLFLFPSFHKGGFQSTHPHGVRPGSSHAQLAKMVSIHAPAWGATTRNQVEAY